MCLPSLKQRKYYATHDQKSQGAPSQAKLQPGSTRLGLIPVSVAMKQLGIFLPPGWDASPSLWYSQHSPLLICTPGCRETLWEMSLARLWIGAARSVLKLTNNETAAHTWICHCEGCGFQAVLSGMEYRNQTVLIDLELVINYCQSCRCVCDLLWNRHVCQGFFSRNRNLKVTL